MYASPRGAPLRALAITTLIALTLFGGVAAHEHHDVDLPDGQYVSPEPLDTILWIHIMVQILAWGIIFPTGMVLGLIKSRWHVPTQIVGTLLAITGYFLGHRHKGRRFGHNAHSSYAPYLGYILAVQISLGIYLRLHIERGFLGRIRPWIAKGHGILGAILPIAAWVQMLFGGIVALGFCSGDHLGQCAAHFIMGSAFIGYGIVLTLLLLVGQMWLRRTGRSQEFFDSTVIAAWGLVNTFTEHHWGGPWVRNDLQHTSMGVVWWCAGLVGMWLSRKRDGRPKRNIIPGIVILLTGYGMSAHPQELMLSTMVHSAFGWTLMAAGATRIVEISFVLRDKDTLSVDGTSPNSFQYLPPFLLYASGFLFMGATEEQMAMLSAAEVTHVSYILLIYSIAFLMFLFVNVLLHIYAVHAFPQTASSSQTHHGDADDLQSRPSTDEDLEAAEEQKQHLNGSARNKSSPYSNGTAYAATNGVNGGVAMSDKERRRVREAQEFELAALISDDEDEGHGRQVRL